MNSITRALLIFQMVTLLQKIYTAGVSIQEHGAANVWPWGLKWLEHSAWIRSLGIRAPVSSKHFLSLKRRHFEKSFRSWVENEGYCARAVNISNIDFTTYMYTFLTTEQLFYVIHRVFMRF